MIFNNVQPKVFVQENIEIGYTKTRIVHNVPVDSDIHSRVIWVKILGAAKPTAIRADTPYAGLSAVYITGLTPGSSYDTALALVDDFVMGDLTLLESQYQNVANVISITTDTLTMKTPVSISNIVSLNNDQNQIGAPASTVRMTMAGAASLATIEASTDDWATNTTVYSGSVTAGQVLDITMSPGTYKLRVSSTFTFGDGTREDSAAVNMSGTISVSDSIVAPSDPTAISVAAIKVLDTTNSYSARVTWNWLLGSGGLKQNTLVSYMEFDGVTSDLSTLDWSTATSEVALSLTHMFQGVPYRKPLAFRVQAQGWNNNVSGSLYFEAFVSEDTADSSKTGYIVPTSGVALPSNTRIQIDNQYINGYDGGANKTFSFDAATGNVTIGRAGTYNGNTVTTPFQFDAENNILGISGQVITDEIVAADFVLGWLAGVAPTLRTANKTGYADSTEGFWMGYTDASTFKVDIGDATQYIRWDGATLHISGNVVIDGGSALDQLQRISIVYQAGTSTPVAPTTGSYANPIPTGWNSSIPTLADGENAYMTQRLFTSDALAPQDTAWTTPGLYTTGGGTPGAPGADGDTSYLHIAYATNVSGTAGFSTTDPVGKTYMGQYTDFSIVDSETPALYTWSKIQGEPGVAGEVRQVKFQYSPDGSTGWHDAPLVNTDTYMREGTFYNGVLQGTYSVGVVIVANDGDSIWTQFQFSPTGTNDWSNTQRVGDIWQHSQLVTNGSGAGYGASVKIKGDDGVGGKYFETRFAKGVTPPALSSTSPVPAGWVIDPNIATTGAEVIWATTATKLYDNSLDTNWTTPIQWAGKSNVVGFLSNEAHLVPADKNGVVSSYAGATGLFNVFVGNVNVTASSTFSIVSNISMVANITTAGVYTTTSISADTSSVTLRATYQGVSIDKVFTVAKSKQGSTGSTGGRGAGVFYVEKATASFPTTLAAAQAVATAAVPNSVPITDDRVTIVNSTTPTVESWELNYTGSTWVEYALKVHGNVLVKGTVAADRVSVVSGNTSVTIDPSSNEIISAYAGSKALFAINKVSGKGILDGLSLENASILPGAFSEQAQDWITNAVGATTNSGGLKTYNGDSGLLSGSPTNALSVMTHVSTNPVTIQCSGSKTVTTYANINDDTADTPPTITLQLYRNGVIMSGKSITVVGTATVTQVGWEPGFFEYNHTYSWSGTVATFTDNPSSGDYTYSVKVTADRYDHITSINLILSAEEQVISAGVDLTNYQLISNALTLGVTASTAAPGNHNHDSKYFVKDTTSGSLVGVRYMNGAISAVGTKIILPYNTNAGKMVAFTVRVYQSYLHTDIVFSGYLYSTINAWSSPKAKIITSTSNAGIVVKMGRDTDGKAYVWIAGGNYRGIAVIDVVGGYNSADWNTGWSIIQSDTVPNLQLNTTVYPPFSPHNLNIGSGSGNYIAGNDSRMTNSRIASDVSSWAKAPSKPTYTYGEVGAASSSHNHDSVYGRLSVANTWSNTNTITTLKIGTASGSFQGDSSYTKFFGGNMYFQTTVPVFYNYAGTTYHGNASGCDQRFRANKLYGDNWGITAVGALGVSLGTQALPSLSFNADTNTGFFRYASDVIGVSCGNSRKMRLATGTYGLIMDSSINLNYKDIINATRVHFSSGPSFYSYDASYIKLKSGGSTGGIRFYDSSDVYRGSLVFSASYTGLQSPSGEWGLLCYANSSTYLRYDNLTRLQTTNAGVTITGTLAATVDVTWSSDIRIKQRIKRMQSASITRQEWTGNTYDKLGIRTGGLLAQQIQANFSIGVTATKTDLVDNDGNEIENLLTINASPILGILVESANEDYKEFTDKINKQQEQIDKLIKLVGGIV